MRIWSIHPKYLDNKGLVALWRESLLAKNVLDNRTQGYKNHPQLKRFKESKDPLACIHFYLSEIYNESTKRNYSFNKNLFSKEFKNPNLKITEGQLRFEIEHLRKKLKLRDKIKLREISTINRIEAHPVFQVIPGQIEDWEKI